MIYAAGINPARVPRATAVTVSNSTVTSDEPLTIDEAKAHCRVDDDEEDDQVESWITAAREYVETNVPGGTTLKLSEKEVVLPCFPNCRGAIELPGPPLSSVRWVKYYNESNALTTLSSTSAVGVLTVIPVREPGYVLPEVNEVWPATVGRPDAVQVRYVAGYATAADVPVRAKQAMKLLISHWNENREATSDKPPAKVELALESLLGSLAWGHYS